MKLIDVPSAWKGLEGHVGGLLIAKQIPRQRYLEFGVEWGYSIAAMSNWFESCVGVDTFEGDSHSGFKDNHAEKTRHNLAGFENVSLVGADFRDFIKTIGPDASYDLIHVDISHDYQSTYDCGFWAAQHAPWVVFHDTTTFPQVRAACEDIADALARRFEIVTHECNGLGLISDKN